MSNKVQSNAEKLLQICTERQARGIKSVIVLFSNYAKDKSFFPPGLLVGTHPTTEQTMVLFDLDEAISALRFFVEAKRLK